MSRVATVEHWVSIAILGRAPAYRTARSKGLAPNLPVTHALNYERNYFWNSTMTWRYWHQANHAIVVNF